MQSLLNELREIDENLLHKAFEWPEEVQAKNRKQEILRELGYIPKGPGGDQKSLEHNIPMMTQKELAQGFNETPQHLRRDIELAKAIETQPELKQIKSKTQAYRKLKLDQKHKTLIEQPFPIGKWQVIYADPPWQFNNAGFEESAASHYPTMNLEKICELPVAEISVKTSVLFLWAVNPLLAEAFEVMKAWGFNYKTNRVWVKDKGPSIGWYLVSKHELLLIGVKSETPHPIKKLDSWFSYDVGPHSKKPPEIYSDIEKMYLGPLDQTFYLELFARESKEGWYPWGNEINS